MDDKEVYEISAGWSQWQIPVCWKSTPFSSYFDAILFNTSLDRLPKAEKGGGVCNVPLWVFSLCSTSLTYLLYPW